MVELAEGLDALRGLAGLSYRDLARKTGCARSTLHDALTARRFPRLDTVLAVVRVCGGEAREWRVRWVAARRRCVPHPTPAPQPLTQLLRALGLPADQVERAVAAWRRVNGAVEPYVVVVPVPRQFCDG